jgi:DNA replication and repair protein RecF
MDFSRDINIITGDNAQGKTNLIEAVSFLSCGKSFRTQKDTDLIMFGKEKAYIKGGFENASGSGEIEALLSRDDKKSIKINSQPIRKLTDIFGYFLSVVFSPEELKIVRESPSMRRRFMDLEISKIRPAYLYDLQNYEKAMQSKNALLKSSMKEEQIKKLTSVFNLQLAEYGEQIIKRRLAFLKLLNEKAVTLHQKLTDGKEQFHLQYKPCVDADNIREALYNKLEASLKSEMENGCTLHGPHREDISFFVNEKDAKIFASQGQQRTAMLSLKLAVALIIKETRKEMPVILLDDVFSELDASRQTALLSGFKNMQIFITTANKSKRNIKNLAFCEYIVKNGDIVKA